MQFFPIRKIIKKPLICGVIKSQPVKAGLIHGYKSDVNSDIYSAGR
jgi:hypothetical protein